MALKRKFFGPPLPAQDALKDAIARGIFRGTLPYPPQKVFFWGEFFLGKDALARKSKFPPRRGEGQT
jgi:hypothetical protein